MRRTVVRSILGRTVLGILVGCDDPTESVPISAIYVLSEVASEAWPVPSYPGSTVEIVGDTLRLREDGTGVQIAVRRDMTTGDVMRTRGDFEWTRTGARLEISLPCNDNLRALCIAPPHLSGLVSDAEWVLDHAAWYELPVAFVELPRR
jgi:hypothetical protein